jgi:hypothetical protein
MLTNKIPSKIPRPGQRVDLAPEDSFLSFTEQDILLLFYASLTDDDFEEVFGDFLVPAKPPQSG